MADALSAARTACAALDRAISQKPVRDGEAFAAATDALCTLRDGLAGPAHDAARGKVNAILSAVLAGHFPLGVTPWSEVELAATALHQVETDLAAIPGRTLA